MTLVLLTLQLGFLFALTRRCGRVTGASMGSVIAYLVWLSAYAVASSVLGARGFYISEPVLATLPGFWVQGLTVAAAVLPIVAFASIRAGVRRIVDVTPWHWFAWFHALRIAAIGTAVKTARGEFPAYFEMVVGVPDLLFGLSALWVGVLAKRGELGSQSFLAWNLVGALVIVPAAPLLLQLGLPGPLQVFTSSPDARVVFTYPMSIAPVMGVPLFVLVNLWVAWRLWERRRSALPRGAIHHLDLTVVDPEASADFYEAVLGRLGYERVRVVGNDAPMWHSRAPGLQLFSIALQRARGDGAAHAHDRYAPGLHHVAFQAASREDVDALHAFLVEMGFRVLDPPAEYPAYAPGYYAVFFSDPDGLKLEFVHMPKPPQTVA